MKAIILMGALLVPSLAHAQEWWAITNPDLEQSGPHTECEKSLSPADAYELSKRNGDTNIRINDKADAVDVAWSLSNDKGETNNYYIRFYRSEAACQEALGAKKQHKDSDEANEAAKLLPYR